MVATAKPNDRLKRKLERHPKAGQHFDPQGRLHHGSRGWNSARAAIEKGLIERKPGICERCGQQHWLCSGHANLYDDGNYKTGRKIGEKPCELYPMHGQSVCQIHGGKGRNRKAAQRQWEKDRVESKAKTQLERSVRTLGLPVTTTPQQALLDELYRSAGAVAWLEAEVGKLQAEDLTWGTASEEKRTGVGEMETEVDLTTTVKQAKPSVLYEMYTRERTHLVYVAKVAIQCGIAERQIKLAEEQGRAIADAIRAVLEAPGLELTTVQLTVARTEAARVLRSLSIGGAPRPVPRLLNNNGHDADPD